MIKKCVNILCLFSLLFLCLPAKKAEASDTLGIIGTALGGTSLGLSLFNTYQNYKIRNGAYGYYPGGRYGVPVNTYSSGFVTQPPIYGHCTYGYGPCGIGYGAYPAAVYGGQFQGYPVYPMGYGYTYYTY